MAGKTQLPHKFCIILVHCVLKYPQVLTTMMQQRHWRRPQLGNSTGMQDGDGVTGREWGGRTRMGIQGWGWEYRTGMGIQAGRGVEDGDGDAGRRWGDRTGMGKKDWEGEEGLGWGGRTRKVLLRPSWGAALYSRPQGRGMLLLGVGAKVPLTLKSTFLLLLRGCWLCDYY